MPADAASGAMATVGGDTALDGHPVMKTPGGWMVQHLTASLAKLYELKTQIGEFTKGQSAFANDLLCPLWWNGEAWIDVMGSAVSADETDAPD